MKHPLVPVFPACTRWDTHGPKVYDAEAEAWKPKPLLRGARKEHMGHYRRVNVKVWELWSRSYEGSGPPIWVVSIGSDLPSQDRQFSGAGFDSCIWFAKQFQVPDVVLGFSRCGVGFCCEKEDFGPCDVQYQIWLFNLDSVWTS